jgi:16S rRNA (cytosine967-C5)-methyltransferase
VTTTAREVALDALVRVEQGAYAHLALPAMLRRSGLADRDRAFATGLVYGTLRAERRLDDLLGRVADRPLARLDAPVRAGLRLGAYQLLDGLPPHAAVGETVSAVAARTVRARGYVNAVLRSVAALGPPWPEPSSQAVALSYPDWIVDRLVDDLGPADASATLTAMNEPGALTLRPNPLRTTADALRDELVGAGITVAPGTLATDALVVRGVGDPARLPAVRDGRATPQDEASQAVVGVLDPQPGERAVDIAAAPGGKATAIAERAGAVVALDVDAARLRLVADASRRLGLAGVACVVADGRALPLHDGVFDRVLVDAPCSGLGVLRRRPDARWRVHADSVDELAALQRALLGAAARAVRAGGVLLYSVCTLTRAETVDVDDWARRSLPELVALAPPGPPWRRHGRGALLLPQDAGTDGMYVLALRRSSSTVS